MPVLTDIKIRMAKLEEAPLISSLVYDAFKEERSYYTDEGFAFTTPGAEIIKDRITDHTVWVAIATNKIVATVSGFHRGEGFYIRSMAVRKNMRRTGLAKALMNYMESIAVQNNCKNLKLTTASFLVPAVKLYESLGFRECGNQDLYGTTLIKMIKEL
jgi:GNAT superfamily N-acetyltransferase